ncbi:hypothetical protein D3C73_1604490 [compost metagenome]
MLLRIWVRVPVRWAARARLLRGSPAWRALPIWSIRTLEILRASIMMARVMTREIPWSKSQSMPLSQALSRN